MLAVRRLLLERCPFLDATENVLSERCFLAAVGKVLPRDVVRKVLLKRCSSLDAFGKGAVGKMQSADASLDAVGKASSERCSQKMLSARRLLWMLLERCCQKDAHL